MKPTDAFSPSDDEAIEATAAAWLAQRDDGLSGDEQAAFERWCAADSRHAAAVARLSVAWASLQNLRDFRPEARAHPDRDLLRMAAARRRAPSFPAVAVAGLAAALVAVAFWRGVVVQRDVGPAAQTYTTTVNGYERVTLADGSLLELNANTEVSAQFSATERRVRLVRGEAHFTVTKNNTRPFLVEAGAVAVRAVGTAFNVRLGTRDVEVLVTEGRVAIVKAEEMEPKPDNSGQSAAEKKLDATPLLGAPSPEVTAGERVIFSSLRLSATSAPTALVVEKVAPEAIREALAWQGPRLVFVDAPLAEAVARFNQRNQIQVVIADAELEALPIGGSFRAENVEAFLRLLEADNDIVVDRTDPARMVLRKRK